jgi:hypothetical protein
MSSLVTKEKTYNSRPDPNLLQESQLTHERSGDLWPQIKPTLRAAKSKDPERFNIPKMSMVAI